MLIVSAPYQKLFWRGPKYRDIILRQVKTPQHSPDLRPLSVMGYRNSNSMKFLGRLYTFFQTAPIALEEPVVIIHSPFKTGTTTIGNALVMLGVGAEDHGYHRNLNIDYKEQMNEANRLALESKSFNRFKRAHGKRVSLLLSGLAEQVQDYRIFGDVPFGHLRMHPFTKKLLMPAAKFIWVDRDETAWLESARRWHLSHPDIYPGFDERWNSNPEREKKKLIKLRDDGFREFSRLQKRFPRDCLVLSLEKDANWDKLCHFLGKDIPDAPFPVLNTSR